VSIELPYSMRRQLAWQLMALTFCALGAISLVVYFATSALFDRSHARLLQVKINKLTETSQTFAATGYEGFRELLVNNSVKRPDTLLRLNRAGGESFYADNEDDEAHRLSVHVRSREFVLPAPDGSAAFRGSFSIDIKNDVEILRSIALVLLAATIVGALIAGASARWVVRHGLHPLKQLSNQTERIASGDLSGRLRLRREVAELAPWVRQFNGLMDKVENTYTQLESFNADVAHELRTPLTALIGKTEVALSRERSTEELNDTLQANLDELQRLAGLINDMLFLSRADHGEMAERTRPIDLAACAAQVAEFYDALLQERELRVEIKGSATAEVDEPLIKRALSNLISNAARFADRGSTLRIEIVDARDEVWLFVANQGATIAEQHLPRLFDRFYRGDPARAERTTHHGLGLAIVAAIARMHCGETKAESSEGGTTIGFSVQR
jgi:two-component system, OmpR family, heavy metal sensor histidine kinase CusS